MLPPDPDILKRREQDREKWRRLTPRERRTSQIPEETPQPPQAQGEPLPSSGGTSHQRQHSNHNSAPMAAGTAACLPLDISVYQDSNDRDTVFCKTLLQVLADGTKDAGEAAHDLDAWVTSESTSRLEELRSRPGLVGPGRESTPNASGYVDRFFQGFPSLCTIFQPHHVGQTRLIAFLEALTAIPTHQAPDSFSNTPNLSAVDSITLWPRGVIDPDTFRVHAAAIDQAGSGLYDPDSEAAVRWRNYQSTLARITMSGFSDCSFLCGLRGILPQDKKYTLPTPKVQAGIRPADLGGRILAAAQWLIAVDEARWVYERCREKEKTDKGNPRDTWSRENWMIWRVQLEFYQRDHRVAPAAREAASAALKQMTAVEAGGGWRTAKIEGLDLIEASFIPPSFSQTKRSSDELVAASSNCTPASNFDSNDRWTNGEPSTPSAASRDSAPSTPDTPTPQQRRRDASIGLEDSASKMPTRKLASAPDDAFDSENASAQETPKKTPASNGVKAGAISVSTEKPVQNTPTKSGRSTPDVPMKGLLNSRYASAPKASQPDSHAEKSSNTHRIPTYKIALNANLLPLARTGTPSA
jgi:hypothetical protein